MPHYHRTVIDPTLNIRYHLAGYGTYYEEALIRLVGEGIERYSSIAVPSTLLDLVRYATYDELSGDDLRIPIEYLRPYSDPDLQRTSGVRRRVLKNLAPDDRIGWLPCHSLFEPDATVWIPAQLVFMGYVPSRAEQEVHFGSSFSTGTAAHTSLTAALLNALSEAVQIDALMLSWYCMFGGEQILVDDPVVAELLAGFDDFEVKSYALPNATSSELFVFVTALVNRKGERPFIAIGSHADRDPSRALYRSAMEAAAITFLGSYGPLFSPREYFPSAQRDHFLNLDSNVGWFSDPAQGDLKRRLIEVFGNGVRKPLTSLRSSSVGKVEEDLRAVVSALHKVSRFAAFLDVTPPEVIEAGWHVVRVVVPELVTMSLPGLPYRQHPRVVANGGCRNEYPHPLP
jgi:thiazole/oxazole-forming peptide maturase SagD family component